MAVTCIALVLPAARGSRINWNYDALFSLKPTYPARQGTEIIERHWPPGEIAPITVLAVTDKPQTDSTWLAASSSTSARSRTD